MVEAGKQNHKNHYGITTTNCIVEQAYALIAVINIIPISIMIHHQRKIKKHKLCRSKKFIAFVLIIVFDTVIFLSYFVNLYKFGNAGKFIKHNDNFVFALLKQIILFLVVFFTFKKASKADIKKQVWISLVKFIFIIGIVVNICFELYIDILEYQKKT